MNTQTKNTPIQACPDVTEVLLAQFLDRRSWTKDLTVDRFLTDKGYCGACHKAYQEALEQALAACLAA